MKSVALAFSGGLDTTFCLLWLQEQGWKVHTVTVDTGGFSPEELARIETVAKKGNAESHTTIDAKSYLFDRFLRYLIFGNVLRGQAYPLSVSAERVAQAKLIAETAQKLGVEAIAHGSTGAGNDQVRFDVAFHALTPNLEIITPIRQLGLSRQESTNYLKERGIEIPAKTTSYSINEGMWGASIGGRETLDSVLPVPEEQFPGGPVDKNAEPTSISITFEKGVPTALNNNTLNPVDLIRELNDIGNRYGIGRGHHLGDTILGIKGRIGFEAPAAHILINAHRELEKLVLSAKQLFWKETLGNLYGTLLHEGAFFDPLARDLEAFLTSSQEVVSGTVNLTLMPYTFQVTGTTSPFSLMRKDIATYGEENKLWTGEDAKGFSRVFSVSQVLSLKNRGGFE